jgi:hypothetical protein
LRRQGVTQFRLLHFMLPRWHALMRRELPGVLDQLRALGGTHVNVLHVLPADLTGGRRDGDDRFDTVTARRPEHEAAGRRSPPGPRASPSARGRR